MPEVEHGYPDSGAGSWNSDATFVFGQSAAFTGVNEHLGIQMRRGIVAAFFEANNECYATYGVENFFGIISYDDIYDADLAENNTETLINKDNVFALIGEVGTPTSKVAYPIAVNYSVPFIGPFTGASFLRTPFHKEIINYRASYIDETASMVRYFADVLQLGRISIFYQNNSFGAAGLEGVQLSLRSRQRQIHSTGTYETPPQGSEPDIMPGLLAMNERDAPEAVVMIGSSTALASFVIASKRNWSGVYYSTVSFVGSVDFARRLNNSSGRDRVFVTQVVPFLWDLTNPIVADYHAAIEPWKPENITADFSALEGYIVGRLATSVIMKLIARQRVPRQANEWRAAIKERVSRSAFLDEVYNSGIISLENKQDPTSNGFRLGPYGANCSQIGSGCLCNQGQHQVYGTYIGRDGGLIAVPQLDFQFESCGYNPGEASRLVFGQSAALTGDSAELGIGMRNGIWAAFNETSASGAIGFRELQLISYDDRYTAARAVENVEKLIASDHVFALIGAVGTPTSVKEIPIAVANQVPFIGAFTGAEDQLRSPFKRLVINVRASYTDECVAMVEYWTKEFEITNISMFLQNGAFGEAGLESLNRTMRAYGMRIKSVAGHAVDSPDIDQEVHDALVKIQAEAGAVPQGVVMFGTYVNLAKFVKAARNPAGPFNWADTHFATVSFVGSEPFSDQLGTAENRRKVLVTQVVPLPTDLQSPIVQEFHSVLTQFVPDAAPSFISLEGYIVGKFAMKVLTELTVDSRSNYVNQVYAAERFEIGGLSLGPYQAGNEMQKGCNQGLESVWLTGMTDNGTFEYKQVEGDSELIFTGSCGHIDMQCTSGKYRASPDEVCVECPAGSEIVNGTQCLACERGRMWNVQTGLCKSCDPGFYSNTTSSTFCRHCNAGRYSNGIAQTECQHCELGKYRGSSAPYTECTNCGSGRFSNILGMSLCEACQKGRYQSGNGTTSCSNCEVPGSTTSTRGTAHRDCCLCPVNFYYAANLNACRNCSEGLTCAGDQKYMGDTPPAIQSGYMVMPVTQTIIPSGSDETRPRIDSSTFILYKCPDNDENFCPGTSNWTDLMSISMICSHDRSGVACGACPPDYASSKEDGCTRCSDSKAFAFAVYILSAPVVALWLYYTINMDNQAVENSQVSDKLSGKSQAAGRGESMKNSKWADISRQKTKKDAQSSGASKKVFRCIASTWEYVKLLKEQAIDCIGDCLKLLLQFFQTVGLVTPLYPPNPSSIVELNMKIEQVMTEWLDFIYEHLDLDCMVGSGFLARFMTAQTLPMAWAFIFLFNLCLSRYLCPVINCGMVERWANSGSGILAKTAKRMLRIKLTWDLTVNCLGTQTTAVFIGITNLSVSIFVTYPHPDGQYSVIKFPQTLTSSTAYKSMVPVAIASLFVYCFGVIAWCSYICYIAPRKASDPEDGDRFCARYDFLLDGWHPSVWWWSVVVLLQGLASNLCVAIMPTPDMTSIAIILVFSFYLTLCVMLTPYENAVLNICNDATSLAVVMVIPAMALRGRNHLLITSNEVAWVEFCAMLIPIAVGVICIIIPVPMFFRKREQAARNAYDSQRVHDMCLLISRMSHNELNEVMAGMIDLDQHAVKTAMRIFAADLCHLQSSSHFFNKRTIRGAKKGKTFNDYHMLELIESEVVDKGRSDFRNIHERALVHYAMEQLAVGKHFHDVQEANGDLNVHKPTMRLGEPRNRDHTLSELEAEEHKAKLFTTALAWKRSEQKSGGAQGDGHAHHQPQVAEIKFLWRFLDRKNIGELTREEFIQAGWESTPDCTRQDWEDCFRLFDVDGTGVVTEEKFFLMVRGIMFGRDNKVHGGTAECLQRVSMNAPGGEKTLDRRKRALACMQSVRQLQRAFRKRRAGTKDLVDLTQNSTEDETSKLFGPKSGSTSALPSGVPSPVEIISVPEKGLPDGGCDACCPGVGFLSNGQPGWGPTRSRSSPREFNQTTSGNPNQSVDLQDL